MRDAFRRGLQWKWERDAGPALDENNKESRRQGASSHWHELAKSSTQRHWPTFAPAAIQKFRRLFSSESARNASVDQALDNGSKDNDHGLESCSRNTSEEHTTEGNMVRMKTKDKNSSQKAALLMSSAEEEFLNHLSSESSASRQFDSLNQPSNNQSQDCTSLSASNVEEEGPVEVKGSVKSHSLHTQSIDFKTKASDNENMSVKKDVFSINQSTTVCDEFKEESPGATLQCEESEALDSFSTKVIPERTEECTLSDKIATSIIENKSLDNMSNYLKEDCVKESLDEETLASSIAVSSSSSILHIKNESNNPSISISTIDAGKTPIQQNKNLLEPLYLNIDSGSGVGAHAKKSPVTVQEWVDSIPLSPHLEEDPEHANTDEDLSLTRPESQIGNVCPSVTLRPASGQSGTVADQRREAFSRDASPSLQSDTGSHASSVDSYLEARRPDPEEVLLGLGFGGSLHAKEAEVSRIPARFLQPSQVKGVAIDDFLRYQQDLIETFESGHSGYRGLTGGSQIPSVIVAKIMEKLREHERESSIKSSAGSSPGHHADISKRRFSRAAHKVTMLAKMKSRDSLTSSAQAHSVLNPDNRKFLDNQGSKSPEVSRKRMIIGHRSFTFDGDGQLIEAETKPEEMDTAEVMPSKPPLPRPLVHKDSVLSSTTSLSLTSYDSDSDTDEASGIDRINNEAGGEKHNFEPYPLQNSSVSDANGNSLLSPVAASLSQSCEQNAVGKISDLAVQNENEGTGLKTSTPVRGVSWKDLHGLKSIPFTPPVNELTPVSVLWTRAEESSSGPVQRTDKNGKLLEYLKQRNQTSRENNPSELMAILKAYSKNEPKQTLSPNTRQLSFYKISDFVLPEDPTSSLDSPESQSSLPADAQQLQRICSIPKSSSMFLDKELRRKLSLNSSVDSYIAGSVAHSPDMKNWSTSSVSSWESEKDFSPKIQFDKVSNGSEGSILDEQTVAITHEPESNSSINRRRGSLKRQKQVEEEELSLHVSSSSTLNVNCRNIATEQADSFEIEEIAIEEEVRGLRTESAHSDSSGFQDEPNHNKLSARVALCKLLSQSEPLLYTQLFPEEPAQFHAADQLKRLSLPVIRVQDESGLTQWRASSVCANDDHSSSSLRRVQSLPSQLARLGLRRLSECFSPGSMTDSIGNMFSSCSDESVIHLPRKSIDLTAEGQSEVFPFPATIMKCCKCNCMLKNSLAKCHSDFLLSQGNGECISYIIKNLRALKEAQNEINNAVQQMQNHSCISSDCKMNDTLVKVASVVQQQNSLCLTLEAFSVELLSTVKNLSARNIVQNLSASTNTPEKSVEEVSLNLENSSGNCETLCRVVEEENHKLQELVQMNVNELTRVRHLLETLIQNG